MAEIIFCKPVYHYDSYTDFWRLVELSGFPIISVSELDITKEGIYITAPMNGDYKEHFVGDLKHFEETGEITGGELKRQKDSGLPRMAHMIIWNLERPSGSKTLATYNNDCFEWFTNRFADEIWVSDVQLADEACLRYVTLGSDYGLGETSEEKGYDLTHMSVEIPRRVQIYKHFGKPQIGQNSWGDERHEVLKKSKFALNVHQDNHPYCEPLRIALFAAYGLPIISETLANTFPYNDEVVTFAYHDIVEGLKVALNDDYDQWKERGLKLRDRLCKDLQFGNVVRQAVQESTGIGWR
ncbi:MAG: hypothetical protein ACW99F_17395 [Candidatus Hodarchaeales archaeon]